MIRIVWNGRSFPTSCYVHRLNGNGHSTMNKNFECKTFEIFGNRRLAPPIFLSRPNGSGHSCVLRLAGPPSIVHRRNVNGPSTMTQKLQT